MSSDDNKIGAVIESAVKLANEGPKSEEKARTCTMEFMNAFSEAFCGGKAFFYQRDITRHVYNPVHQVRLFHERHSMRHRLNLGLVIGIVLEVYFPSRLRLSKVLFWSYVMCPEFFSIFFK